jgi:hypothetical protein
VSDREVLIGLMNAVLAIGEKITGEKMTVHVPAGEGLECSVRLAGSEVEWTNGETGQTTSRHLVSPHTPS